MKFRLIRQPYLLFIFPYLYLGQSNEDLAKLAARNRYINFENSKTNSNHQSLLMFIEHLVPAWALSR